LRILDTVVVVVVVIVEVEVVVVVGSTSPSLCLFEHPLPHLLSVFPATRKMFHGARLERFYNSGFRSGFVSVQIHYDTL